MEQPQNISNFPLSLFYLLGVKVAILFNGSTLAVKQFVQQIGNFELKYCQSP